MLLIPAIDLKGGQCVRLQQGLMDKATVFSDEPAEMAVHWCQQGARRLHLVDLDGAFAGKPENMISIKSILEQVADNVPVQLGGGIRDLHTIERYLQLGLSYVIIGTAAVKNPQFVRQACAAFPGQIIVGLDAKDGMVAIDGWATVTDFHVTELAKQFVDDGVNSIIYTDIGRDGMMGGVNIDATVKLAREASVPVIASGGVTNMADVEALCAVAGQGVAGAIVGRAIYEGSLDLAAAQRMADQGKY
ncbi:1-(5-phosphoribosyl)-5-[(5-phosphoribosylamino)methylideneamino]imidazole-4-carboxamide isomerase [Snodgrassella sp. ESL0253]|uniref:1-(5-phosphoribosyl)-5-[(5- phosphoribosylamino)methylideneamino]imidazole-4- carboxamide isomerase n=1 Tax=Snodgrassella sp. ESL0253 TaxID=2705031 RepID=UPI0015829D07|nr:1-(5-phosphoribosyl)-5-[(5-phosphoribosylamino)methylideneamino]imidazole-4-carboxamide isomerase [Snodgrassella sp. ESL0253]NUE66497.1 1-(5-phosphoribosyl)-5-[(5-phosphoribosylamino)methylideneamino]imidazole-4-carboxamide isomerase [Snodgrassella sp. ESL0253]